jgi:two-component system chemotaxis response regulator CheY
MKILVVDDSRMIQSLVRESLEARGIDVVSAENGEVARKTLLEIGDVDLILLDWNMPVMDGSEFLDSLQKEKFSSAPVIMMTTENSPEKINLAIEKGVAEFIMKPFTDDVLFGKIEMVTGVAYAV